jgi:hypothetical protein
MPQTLDNSRFSSYIRIVRPPQTRLRGPFRPMHGAYAMDGSALESLGVEVDQINDPHVQGPSDHLLFDIVGVTTLAVLCGCDDWVAVELIANSRRDSSKSSSSCPSGSLRTTPSVG